MLFWPRIMTRLATFVMGMTTLLVCSGLILGCHSRIATPSRAIAQPLRLTKSTYIDPTGIHFVDRAQQAGLDYTFHIPGRHPFSILMSIGNGCAFLDYDNDGNLDVLLVGYEGPKLFRGDGRGHFRDVTAQVGLVLKTPPGALWLGCAVGDIDNDGYPDIYLSGYHTAALLHNNGGKRFEDITRHAGIHPELWGTSCGFADIDGDGKLDLFVANYVSFQRDAPDELCQHAGQMTGCDPAKYHALPPTFYHNLGGNRFRDETRQRGFDRATGKGLGIAFADYRNDGRPAVFLANDAVPSDLMFWDSQGRFVNVGAPSGISCAQSGHVHSGMGIDWGDYNEDRRFDAFVTTFHNEAKSLYANNGDGTFTDVAEEAGTGSENVPHVSFGIKWIDYDNDGWEDLLIASGHIRDNIHLMDPEQDFRQPTQLLRNLGRQSEGKRVRFAEVSSRAGDDLGRPIVGRGLAIGDYDNDGRMDALVVDSMGRPLLLHNEKGKSGHWLGVRLIGTKSNRDGYGATLTATVGKRKLLRQCQSSGSYLSASDKRVHFGLGVARIIDTLTIRWPSGKVDILRHLQADRYIILTEDGGQSKLSNRRIPPTH